MELSVTRVPVDDVLALGGDSWGNSLQGGFLCRGYCHWQGFLRTVFQELFGQKGENSECFLRKSQRKHKFVAEKISEDIFSRKQLSMHAEITNTYITEDLLEKSKEEKTTKVREFTIIRRNYSGNQSVL